MVLWEHTSGRRVQEYQIKTKVASEKSKRSISSVMVSYAALLIFSLCVGSALADIPANKTTVLKIAVVFPFDESANLGIPYTVALNPGSVLGYNAALRYADKVNNDPTMMPGVRLQIVGLNSQYDRGTTLLASINASNMGAYAIIGEATSRSSVVAGLVAATSNMLHCNVLSATTQLSVKSDYPFSFRVLATLDKIAYGMIRFVLDQNVQIISVIGSNDEFGQSAMTAITTLAPQYNITIDQLISTPPASKNYTTQLMPLLTGKARTFLHFQTYSDGAYAMVSADQLGMLDGRFQFIGYGYNPNVDFGGAAATLAVLPKLNGLILIQSAYANATSSKELADQANWYQSMMVPGSLNVPILDNSSNPLCDNFPGCRPCFNNSAYCAGYSALWAQYAQTNVPYPLLSTLGQLMYHCMDAIVQPLNYYLKQGVVTPQDAVNRVWMAKAAKNNVSALFNRANIADSLFPGKTLQFDQNGDINSDLIFLNWFWPANASSGTMGIAGSYRYLTDTTEYYGPVTYFGNATTIPQPPPIPINQYAAQTNVRYAFNAIVAVCCVFTLVLAGFSLAKINTRIIKASAPLFLFLIIMGANISFISIWIFSMYPMNDSSCVTFVWLKYIGFAVVFGALIVKTYRISVIFAAKKRKTQNLSDGVMFIYFIVIVAFWSALLIIGTVIPSQRAGLVTDSNVNVDTRGNILSIDVTPHCDLRSYNFVLLVAMVITLVVGVWLTYTVRNTPSAFNETQWIAYATYNWVVIGIVLNAITNFAVRNPDVIFIMEALTVIITQTGVCGFLFVPKIIAVYNGTGDAVSTMQSSSNTSGSPSKAGVSMNSDPSADIGALKAEIEALKKKLAQQQTS